MLATIVTSALTAALTGLIMFLVQERRLRTQLRTEFMAEQAVKALLETDRWTKRSFAEIKKRLQGFGDDELRKILVRAGAIRFEASGDVELWGLISRNKEDLSAGPGITNPRGWYRLGVSISVCWVILVFAVVAYEYFLMHPSDTLWFLAYVPGSVPDPRYPNIVWDVLTLNIYSILAWTIVPLVVAWTVVPLIAWVVTWVRSGFKSGD